MTKFKSIYGLNGHVLGIILKDMARRAHRTITKELGVFTQKAKVNEHKAEDVVTSADYAAQKEIVRVIKECLPFAGIVAEEDLRKEPTRKRKFYVTIDPVDGTKAFARKQSDGIGCLISYVLDGDIIGALVMDIMTGEIYYYRPGSKKVHRLSPARHEILKHASKDKKRVLLYDDPRIYSDIVQACTHPQGGFFASVDVSNGSIGTNLAKLWKGEVQAVILKPAFSQPWDYAPVVGISHMLGYRFYEITSEGLTLCELYEGKIDFRCQDVGEIVCIHENDVESFIHYCREKKLFTATV